MCARVRVHTKCAVSFLRSALVCVSGALPRRPGEALTGGTGPALLLRHLQGVQGPKLRRAGT